jgi:D-arabinose 5-phosphate isomerase GutQ
MKTLQDMYDSQQLSRDPGPMNALAAEARDYQQQVAAMTYSRQSALVRQFDAIMAVPVTACQVAVVAK